MLLGIILKGFATTMGLIAAIGAQNTFIIRQGLMRQHVAMVVATCFICDIILVAIGVYAVDYVITAPMLEKCLTVAGIVFLFTYATLSLRSAIKGGKDLAVKAAEHAAWWPILLATVAVTFLNPHAWLDTVVILGGICVAMDFAQKSQFLIGALIGSGLWFISLGFGARLLTPCFRSPRAWQILDSLTAVMMYTLGMSLLKGLIG